MEARHSKLERENAALRAKIERLEWRLNDEACRREIVWQLELLSLLDILISKVDEHEISPAQIRIIRAEKYTARKSIGIIKSIALQRLSAMHEGIEQDAEESRNRK